MRPLGSGGMGNVHQARRLSDGALVAIKLLRPDRARHREYVSRLRREGRAAAKLKSPHAVRIIEAGESPDRKPFIVMEYLDGCDLLTELENRGILPISEATAIIAQACRAMIEAHDLGIVHRDLKPANIFLANVGGERIVKVLDFGISKVPDDGAETFMTKTKASFGSPAYMSPEQLRSAKHVDARSDIWSLGVILYEAVTGELPFEAANQARLALAISRDPHIAPSARRPEIPKSFDDVIAGALQKDPRHRYQSARELLRAIEPVLPSDGWDDTVVDPPRPVLDLSTRAELQAVLRRRRTDPTPTLVRPFVSPEEEALEEATLRMKPAASTDPLLPSPLSDESPRPALRSERPSLLGRFAIGVFVCLATAAGGYFATNALVGTPDPPAPASVSAGETPEPSATSSAEAITSASATATTAPAATSAAAPEDASAVAESSSAATSASSPRERRRPSSRHR